MIGWLRRVFSHRERDPELERLTRLNAARVNLAGKVAARATDVAQTVARDRDAEMRASFARAGRRLGRR